MAELHVDVDVVQTSRHPGAPCGDVVIAERRTDGTAVLLADGLGHGVRANLFAGYWAAQIRCRLRDGASAHRAFEHAVSQLEINRGTDVPWAALTLVWIAPGGEFDVLSYEAPPPVLVSNRHTIVLEPRPVPATAPTVGEASGVLRPGDGLLLMSDGVTQAGLGRRVPGRPRGWTAEGVGEAMAGWLAAGVGWRRLPRRVLRQAHRYWGRAGDDITAVGVVCREGRAVTVMTGPPIDPDHDAAVVGRFLAAPGVHVVCGAKTAHLVARHQGVPLAVARGTHSPWCPPPYDLPGVDLATEGAVCLNQLLNILDLDPRELDHGDPVTRLHGILLGADRVRFVLGGAVNPASESLVFKQRGILRRRVVVPRLAEKLREMGKLVEVVDV